MPKLEKSTDCGHKLISSEDGQDTSACKISGHSLHAFSGKCPETSPDGRTDRRTDGHAVKRSRLVGWTNGPMYRAKEGISGFGRTDRPTDRPTDGQTRRRHKKNQYHFPRKCVWKWWLLSNVHVCSAHHVWNGTCYEFHNSHSLFRHVTLIMPAIWWFNGWCKTIKKSNSLKIKSEFADSK